MTYFNRGDNSSRGGQSYGRRDSFDRGSDRPAMFDAVCAKCGSACQVPFRPNGRKEVFCSKCFETNGGGGSRYERESRSFDGKGSYEKRDSVGTYQVDRPMFSAICDECGDNCKIPFEPRNGKPVLCSKCFAAKNTDSRYESKPSFTKPARDFSKPAKDNTVELEAINAKLDKIIRLLAPQEAAKADAKVVAREITSKIVEEIAENSGKEVLKVKKTKVPGKKKTVSKAK